MRFTLFIFILISVFYQAITLSCNSYNIDSPTLTSNEQGCQNQDETIHKLIEKFRNSEYETECVVNEFVTLSSQSVEFRQLAIQELLKIVNDYKEARTPEEYSLWNGAVLTLGKLKAIEAIDSLGNCLDCNNKLAGYTLERYPAAYTISKIGKPAIPKLLEILSQKPEEHRLNRFLAVIALSRIAGKEEKEALNRFLKIEKDKLVALAIRDILKRIE